MKNRETMGIVEQAALVHAMAQEFAESVRLEMMAKQLEVEPQEILLWCCDPSEGGRLLRRYLETGLHGNEPDPPST